jgi:hypothetical protein
MLDTSTVILLGEISDSTELPDESVISAITRAELSVGPHVAPDDAERSARQQHLQQAEADFDVVPFDGDCGRAFGGVALVELGLRPTQIVTRNLAVTSEWAHRIWSQSSPAIDDRKWQAVQWWSFHRPTWTVVASWERPKLVELERLNLDHPAVVAAAKSLNRPV